MGASDIHIDISVEEFKLDIVLRGMDIIRTHCYCLKRYMYVHILGLSSDVRVLIIIMPPLIK